MLFLLIPVGWVAAVSTIVALCRIAARADALAPASTLPAASVLTVGGLTVWDCGDPIRVRRLALALRSGAPAGARRPGPSFYVTPSSASRVRGGRRSRCVA